MTETATLDKTADAVKPYVSKRDMRKHDFSGGLGASCAFCGATREQVDDNIVHSYCFAAERKDELASGEYATRVGTVYLRSKAHLSETMRAKVMAAIADVLQAGSDATRLQCRVVSGTTLIIEMRDA